MKTQRERLFSADDLSRVLAELRPALLGARVQNVWDDDEGRAWVFKLRCPEKKALLLVSTRPRFSRVHLVESRRAMPPRPASFCQVLRARLKGTRVVRLEQIGGDRIVEMSFAHGRRSDPDDSGETTPTSVTLVLHFFGPTPEALVLGARRTVLASSLELSGGASRYTSGSEYKRPTVVVSATTTDEQSHATDDEDSHDFSDGECRFNREISLRLGELERESVFREARDTVLRAVERERVRRTRTCQKISADLEACRGRDRDRELGELLKGAFGQLRRGLEEIEVVNYFAEDLAPITVALDPKLSPEANVERYFKRYRKAQRGIPVLEERLQRLAVEETRIDAFADELRACETLDAVRQVQAGLTPLLRRSRRGNRPRRRDSKTGEAQALGPRRFVTADGWEILVGRNARQNDELTLKTARGNDVFLHVSGRSGSHVIIRTQKDKSVPTRTLLDAAQLAVYYSLPKRSGGALIVGATADVDYTPVKRVHKPKGARPGAVLLASHKSLRIKLEQQVIERLRQGPGGIDPMPQA